MFIQQTLLLKYRRMNYYNLKTILGCIQRKCSKIQISYPLTGRLRATG